MDSPRGCRIRLLASNEFCTVEYCQACGLFYVTLGVLTLRVKLASLHAVSHTLANALRTYKDLQKEQERAGKILPFRTPENQVH